MADPNHRGARWRAPRRPRPWSIFPHGVLAARSSISAVAWPLAACALASPTLHLVVRAVQVVGLGAPPRTLVEARDWSLTALLLMSSVMFWRAGSPLASSVADERGDPDDRLFRRDVALVLWCGTAGAALQTLAAIIPLLWCVVARERPGLCSAADALWGILAAGVTLVGVALALRARRAR